MIYFNSEKKSPLLALLNSRLRRGFGGQAKRLEISPKNACLPQAGLASPRTCPS